MKFKMTVVIVGASALSSLNSDANTAAQKMVANLKAIGHTVEAAESQFASRDDITSEEDAPALAPAAAVEAATEKVIAMAQAPSATVPAVTAAAEKVIPLETALADAEKCPSCGGTGYTNEALSIKCPVCNG